MVAPTEERTQQDVSISEMTVQDFFAGVYMVMEKLGEVEQNVSYASRGVGPLDFRPRIYKEDGEPYKAAYAFADEVVAYRQRRGRPTEDVVGH